MTLLSSQQLAELAAIDTPTICNAIERFKQRDDTTGFIGTNIRCAYPQFPPAVGYALTVEVDTTTPNIKRDPEVWKQWVRAMEIAPKPVFLVFKDVSSNPERSAHIGEVMATLASRLGVAALLTDGGVRDLNEVQALGMQMFSRGPVASHGNPRLVTVNHPVIIDGVYITPGDLLHGDLNGVTLIPPQCASQLAQKAAEIRAEEGALLEYIKSPQFEVEEFLRRKFSH